jgi:hypothetical protein
MKEFEKLNLGMVAHIEGVTLEVESILEQQIREGQLEDEEGDQRDHGEGQGPGFC